jgi:signal transduction histidine kinase
VKAEIRTAERRHALAALRVPMPAPSVSRRRVRLSDQLLDAREAERRLLARDLHDGLGQSLVLLQMNLRIVLESVSAVEATTELLDASIELAGRLHRQVRARALALHSSVLDDLGIVAALRSHTAELARSAPASIIFQSDDATPAPRFPHAIESSAFRIAQEALTNAIRHSKAARMAVTVAVGDRRLEVRIEDDGVGFDPGGAHAGSRGRSLGLVSMSERARLAGGHLKITSTPGRGTTVLLRFERRRPRLANTAQ